MLLRRVLLCLLVLCTVFALCACGGKRAAAPTTEATEKIVTYTVKVVDQNGTPVEGITVQLCLDSCFLGQTDANGVATYEAAEGDYKVNFMVIPMGYAPDSTEYHFEPGKYDLTLTLQKVG